MSPTQRIRDTAGSAPEPIIEAIPEPIAEEPDELDTFELDTFEPEEGDIDTDENRALLATLAGEPLPGEPAPEIEVEVEVEVEVPVEPEPEVASMGWQGDYEPEPEPEPEPAAAFADEPPELERLRRLGKVRDRQQKRLEHVERQLLDEAIPAALRAGVPKRIIARESGVARQTVYNVLARETVER